MSSRVTQLVPIYRQHLEVPWQAGLAAVQRIIFAVYDTAPEQEAQAQHHLGQGPGQGYRESAVVWGERGDRINNHHLSWAEKEVAYGGSGKD